MERNRDEGITYEVVLRGDKFDCTLRNFYADGQDLPLREDFKLPGGLVHASKENILKKTFEEMITLFTGTFKSKKFKDEEEKELYSSLIEELKTLDYEKLQKSFIREKTL